MIGAPLSTVLLLFILILRRFFFGSVHVKCAHIRVTFVVLQQRLASFGGRRGTPRCRASRQLLTARDPGPTAWTGGHPIQLHLQSLVFARRKEHAWLQRTQRLRTLLAIVFEFMGEGSSYWSAGSCCRPRTSLLNCLQSGLQVAFDDWQIGSL